MYHTKRKMSVSWPIIEAKSDIRAHTCLSVTFDERVSFDILRQTQHRPPLLSTGNLNITDQSHDQSQLDYFKCLW